VSELETRSPNEPARIEPELRRNFAVVIPAYNEVENMPALFTALAETFSRHDLEGEVVLVDDGSTDGTYEAALREAERIDRATVVRHRRNLGKTEAMVTGRSGMPKRLHHPLRRRSPAHPR
jgi:cellulose synthase/poly-beta-1,6-N-acetylglucosamine synthase-like glycosyltransferase